MKATTFSALWDEMKADAAAAIGALEADAKAFEDNIVPVIEADIVAVLSQFKTLAIQTVIEMASGASASLSGEEKLGTVVTTVLQKAEASAVTLALGDAQTLAQQAFNAVATTLAPKN